MPVKFLHSFSDTFLFVFTGHFSMDKDTGLLKLAGMVDREKQSSYTLDILATDQGTARLTNTTTIYINITVCARFDSCFDKNTFALNTTRSSTAAMCVGYV